MVNVNLASFPWSKRPSVARASARRIGATLHVRCDGAGVLYYMDGGRLRQKTWQAVRPVRVHGDVRDYAAEVLA